jgi:hypothetical protein
MLKTKEHYDLLSQFEKDFKDSRLLYRGGNVWAKKIIYQDGNVNNLFLAYREGYSLGKAIGEQQTYN